MIARSRKEIAIRASFDLMGAAVLHALQLLDAFIEFVISCCRTFIHTGGDTYLGSYNDPVLAWRSTQIAVATLATLATPIVVPLLVQDLVARAVEGQVELSWVLGAITGEIASVEVERALEAEGPWSVRTPAPLAPEPRIRFVDSRDSGEPVWYRLALHVQGGVLYAGPVAIEPSAASGRTTLAARQPGPGQPVEIRYTIGRPAADLRLGVFDVRGRRVRLLEAGARTAGSGLRYWDRRDDSGVGVTRGVYFVLLDAGAARVTRKLVLVHE